MLISSRKPEALAAAQSQKMEATEQERSKMQQESQVETHGTLTNVSLYGNAEETGY